ncbi:MAG: Na+/H+ antiporter NhaC family protein [Blautia caecimuris]
MGENTNGKTKKTPGLGLALLPLAFMFVVLFLGLIIFSIDIKILLLICAAFTIVLCLFLGYTWKDVENEIVDKLAKAFPAIMILITVGLMIGAWIVSGTIPFLVYIGLQIINPKFIIVTSFLVTVILSVSTGTSWGAAGTVGAALMSVAAGMGAPLPAVAGAIVAGSLLKKPTIPVMMISSAVAVVIAMTVQDFSFQTCATSMVSGFKMEMFTDPSLNLAGIVQEVPNLLQRGGMASMMNTALMAFCAFGFIGALTVSGCLDVILSHIMKHIHGTGQLITVTALLGVIIITVIGEASVTFLMIGGLFREEYIKRGLETKNLSRTLEDSITVVEPLVPWSLAGVYMTSTLGVPTAQYAPWACLCYTGVIFAIIWGFTGFGIAKIKKGGDNYDEYVELTGKEL